MNDREEVIALHVKGILKVLGYDVENDKGLKETPGRVARYYLEFLHYDAGYLDKSFSSMQADQMVIVKNIPAWSLCEHHLLPMKLEVTVGYLTGSKVIGLSKIPRLVQKHCHRLQLQERIANDVAEELQSILSDAPGVAVYIKGEHLCMQMRGIRSEGGMVTSVVLGEFRDNDHVNDEFMRLAKD